MACGLLSMCAAPAGRRRTRESQVDAQPLSSAADPDREEAFAKRSRRRVASIPRPGSYRGTSCTRLASSATPTYLSRRVKSTRFKTTSCSPRTSTRASMVATLPGQARKRRRGASPAPGTAPCGAATPPAAGARRVSWGWSRSVRRSSRSP